ACGRRARRRAISAACPILPARRGATLPACAVPPISLRAAHEPRREHLVASRAHCPPQPCGSVPLQATGVPSPRGPIRPEVPLGPSLAAPVELLLTPRFADRRQG